MGARARARARARVLSLVSLPNKGGQDSAGREDTGKQTSQNCGKWGAVVHTSKPQAQNLRQEGF